jgi:hypothetical protein
MRKFILVIGHCFLSVLINGQSPATIISDLKSVNQTIAIEPCNTGEGSIISNRAMNLFLADRIGYYLSQYDDISFDKNYITFNSSNGVFSLNHNFFQVKGNDEQVRAFTVGGIKANVANAFEFAYTGKQFNNEIGITVKRTWIAKVKTHFNSCTLVSSAGSQKHDMDGIRASILYSLQVKLNSKQAEFERELDSIKPSDVPDQDINRVKTHLKQKFYNDMLKYCSLESARLQSDDLIETANYNFVSTSWTSINGYIPMFPEKYLVAGSFNGEF